MKHPARFKIAIYDKDVFSSNDSICECNLSLHQLLRKAWKTKDMAQITVREGINITDRIWIEDLRHSNYEGSQGKVEVSFQCMPLAMARQLPAGLGRGEPNMNPVLPEPEGRAKFSILHPMASLRNLMGDRMYYKLLM